MRQLIIENATKTIGEKTLFQNISFTIVKGEKIGLVGLNGSGKSTLLSILAGIETVDHLNKEHPNDYRIAYLPQQPNFEPHLSVMETVFLSDAPMIQLNLAYERAVADLASFPNSQSHRDRFAALQIEMDEKSGWDLNTKVRTILTKLGITNTHQLIGQLSGGQQKRVALAKVLLEPADLYLLDEPTNHLDVDAIEWLQNYLVNEQGAVLFITHDRYFLDAVTTHIYELADQTIYRHIGNYASFLEAKALRMEQAQATEAKLKNKYRAELKWIQRGARARSTKQKARIERFENLEKTVQKKTDTSDLTMNLQTSRLGKKVIELHHVSKYFQERPILRQFSQLLKTGDRVGIIGSNGAGKTTLLNLIAGHLEPDEGMIDKGTTVRLAFFQQLLPPMNEQQRVISFIQDTSNDLIDAEGVRISATQMLERFLFPSHMHGTPIGQLSGGERKRLYLLKLLMEQPNVLLLDEPTNDLDIETLTVLEEFIDSFPGVVLTVSHDRFFLDRIAQTLWILNGEGDVQVTQTLYSDYLATAKQIQSSAEKSFMNPSAKTTPMKKKMSYTERKEWETIESEIEQLEDKIRQVEAQMVEAGSQYEVIEQLTKDLERLTEIYEERLERWSYLHELHSVD